MEGVLVLYTEKSSYMKLASNLLNTMNYEFCIGEFGRVYKGLWTHRSSVDGQEIIEEVAVKTIKSMYDFLDCFIAVTII